LMRLQNFNLNTVEDTQEQGKTRAPRSAWRHDICRLPLLRPPE
jgi:hypothetical protein